MNIDDLKRTIFGCAEMDEMMIKSANDTKKYDTYVVYDDSKSIEYIDLNGKVINTIENTLEIVKFEGEIEQATKLRNEAYEKLKDKNYDLVRPLND